MRVESVIKKLITCLSLLVFHILHKFLLETNKCVIDPLFAFIIIKMICFQEFVAVLVTITHWVPIWTTVELSFQASVVERTVLGNLRDSMGV